MSSSPLSSFAAAQATEQLLEALFDRRKDPGELADASLAAAFRHCEGAFAQLQADDRHGPRQPARPLGACSRPPAVELMLDGVSMPVDVGYDFGVHLYGLRGVWHQLWLTIAFWALLGYQADRVSAVLSLRAQLETLVGRSLSPDEWRRVSEQAVARFRSLR